MGFAFQLNSPLFSHSKFESNFLLILIDRYKAYYVETYELWALCRTRLCSGYWGVRGRERADSPKRGGGVCVSVEVTPPSIFSRRGGENG